MARAWKYGDNVDTDVIIPARYLVTGDPQELAKHCLENLDPRFVPEHQPGDIIVGGKNFGCGSSREHAPIAIKGSGVPCIIATSFARIFYRNAVNIGLPVYESPEASAGIQMGDDVTVDEAQGLIINHTRDERYPFRPLPPFMQEIVRAGGLMQKLKRELEAGTVGAS
jgi:3-isopropylmalate/(R)-2-methylmalate dehydratase small subunit